MEVVLDTNIVVSAAISSKGPPAQVIKAWRAHSFVWITSPALVEELERTLRSRRLKAYVTWSNDDIDDFLIVMLHSTKLVTPTRQLEVIKDDPDDNRVLEAALEASTDYIVSGDTDLLDLGRYEGTEIVTPARFLAILATDTP